MADKKLSELTELAATPASDDEVYIRDVSEEAATESKRITIANLLAGVAGVPSGVILMWHGTIASIPAGWVICDGNNGTPNLLAKFIEGVATAATNPGATGGAVSKTTAGHTHGSGAPTFGIDGFTSKSLSATDSIADIRPPYYDIAFIMKT